MNVTTAVSLAGRTTLRVGGPATEFVEARTSEEAIDAVADADARGIPVLILGGGSNVLIGDAGFDGRVVAIASTGITEEADMCSGAMVTVAAGENWDALVARAVTNGWTGIEALSGIPGLVGGTPIQNVGAYGQDVSATIARVRTYDRTTTKVRTFFAADCGFGYRSSRFKTEPGRYLILDVTFQFGLGDSATRSPTSSSHAGSVSSWGSGRPSPTSDVPSWTSAQARGWCSTRPTTTPGARARSSPTRSWTRPPRTFSRPTRPAGRWATAR